MKDATYPIQSTSDAIKVLLSVCFRLKWASKKRLGLLKKLRQVQSKCCIMSVNVTLTDSHRKPGVLISVFYWFGISKAILIFMNCLWIWFFFIFSPSVHNRKHQNTTAKTTKSVTGEALTTLYLMIPFSNFSVFISALFNSDWKQAQRGMRKWTAYTFRCLLFHVTWVAWETPTSSNKNNNNKKDPCWYSVILYICTYQFVMLVVFYPQWNLCNSLSCLWYNASNSAFCS